MDSAPAAGTVASPPTAQQVIDYWISPSTGLQGLLSTLVPLVEIQAHSREQSLAARRTLAEKTKEFKRAWVESASAEKPSPQPDVKALLKCYQDEIDTLTRRCKSSDSGLNDVLALLRQAPDPCNVLTGVLSSLLPPPPSKESSSDAALVSELRAELAAYEEEFATLKNQDIKVRSLEREVASLQSQLASVKSAVDASHSAASSSQSRESDLLHDNSRLAASLASERSARLSLERLLASKDVAASDEDDAQRAENSLLLDHHASEASRLSDIVATLTGDNAQLKRKLDKLEALTKEQGVVGDDEGQEGERAARGGKEEREGKRSGGGGHLSAAERDAYEAEISDLALAAARQKEEICSLSVALNSLQEESGREAKQLSELVAKLQGDVQAAKAIGDERPTMQELEKAKRERRRLRRALRDLAAASGGLLSSSFVSSSSSSSSEMIGSDSSDGGDDASDVDTVLSARLRTVEASLLAAKREAAETSEALRDADDRFRASERERDRLKILVDKLDEDLGQVLKQQQQQQQQALLQSSAIFDDSSNGAMLQRVLLDPKSPAPFVAAPHLSALSPFPPMMSPLSSQSSSATPHTVPSDGFVGIVMSQRDRLKEKVASLESERDGFRKELEAQVRLADNLQRENLQMYEKLKFMSSRGGGNGSGARSGGGGGGGASASAYDGVDLEALEARYEVNDPLKQFAAEEKKRRLKKITAGEKTVFSVGKILLSNSEARSALFFYVLGMHLLVFITCYHWAHEKTCDEITDFHPSLLDSAEISHMAGNGPPPLDVGGN